MTIDYQKLIRDLRDANKAAEESAEKVDDGGSANLDRVFLRIPYAREKQVIEAIQEAGLYCRGKSQWLGQGYFIDPTVGGQGDKRTIAAETMCSELNDRGWKAMMFYKVD